MQKLAGFISRFYAPEEYPALTAQLDIWRQQRPLTGIKVLDGTPVFRNTLIKYSVLLAGGANLTVSSGIDIPCDQEILRLLPEFGIRIADKKILSEKFDVIADCAGRHRTVSSVYGYAELTRSGLEYYRCCRQPVISVDSGILKQFETTLGTGESFVRAMKHLGYTNLTGKNIVVFGGGKVGRGTAYFASREKMNVVIIDKQDIIPPENVSFIRLDQYNQVAEAIRNAWIIVSATGLAGALAKYVPLFRQSEALIANMGVEDEFGTELPEKTVLNNKLPLNFILDEPTRINYIDPSMALSNEALNLLVHEHFSPGINLPPAAVEKQIIACMRQRGNMNDEINMILKDNKL